MVAATSHEPRVCVVLPTFGRPDYLVRAVDSVRAQTFGDWELVVVDDNPGDSNARRETQAALGPLKAADGRIRVIEHAQNLGACAARNTGAASTGAEFLAFLDDDDEWLPAKLDKQLPMFAGGGGEIGLVYAGHRRVFSSGKPPVDILPRGSGGGLRELLHQNLIGTTSSVVVRRAAFEAVGGFDVDFPANQDYDLYLRLAEAGHTFAFVPEVLTLSHRHASGNIGRNTAAKVRAFELLLERHRVGFDEMPSAELAQIRRIAELLVHRGQGADARRVIRGGPRSRHRDLALRGLWILSLLPVTVARQIATMSRAWRTSRRPAVTDA